MSIVTLLEMIASDRPDRPAARVEGVDTSLDRVRTLACGAARLAAEARVSHLVRLGTGGLADLVTLFGAAEAAMTSQVDAPHPAHLDARGRSRMTGGAASSLHLVTHNQERRHHG